MTPDLELLECGSQSRLQFEHEHEREHMHSKNKHKHTEVDVVPEEEAHGPRHDDGRGAVRDQVDSQQRQRGESGQQQLVPPADVEHVVREPEQQHAADAQQARDELNKLRNKNPFEVGYKICSHCDILLEFVDS